MSVRELVLIPNGQAPQSLDVACPRKGVTSGEVRILRLRKILKELTP